MFPDSDKQKGKTKHRGSLALLIFVCLIIIFSFVLPFLKKDNPVIMANNGSTVNIVNNGNVNNAGQIGFEHDNKCLIKGNINQKGQRLYYLPTHSRYKSVKIDKSEGELYFCSEGAAIKAGWDYAGSK